MIEYQLEYLFVLVVVAALLLLMRSFFKGLGAADAPRAQARRGGGVSAISDEPSLEEDELSDDALAGIGIDAAGILGYGDASGALEGSEELEIALLQRANSVQSNPEIVVELMRTWLGSEGET